MKKRILILMVVVLSLSIIGCDMVQRINLGLKISQRIAPVEVVSEFVKDLTAAGSTSSVQGDAELSGEIQSLDYLADTIEYQINYSSDSTFLNTELPDPEEVNGEYDKNEFENLMNDDSEHLRQFWSEVSLEDSQFEAILDFVEANNLEDADWDTVDVKTLEELEALLSNLVKEKPSGGWIVEDQLTLIRNEYSYDAEIVITLNSNEKIEMFEVTFLEELLN